MKAMTLNEWKLYFAEAFRGTQNGPNDTRGWKRDHAARAAVQRARTWGELADAAPAPFLAAAINHCKISEL